MSISQITRDVHELTDPRTIPGLQAWYDARYPNGIGSAMPFDGDTLSTWTDLSGKGNHLIQANAEMRPVWRSQTKNLLDYAQATASSLHQRGVTFTNPQLLYNSSPRLSQGVSTEWSSETGTSYKLTMLVTDVQNFLSQNIATKIPVKPNTTYTITAEIYSSNRSGYKWQPYVQWYDINGAHHSQKTSGGTLDSPAVGQSQFLARQFTTPPDVYYMSYLMGFYNVETGDVYYIDKLGWFEGEVSSWSPPVVLPNKQPVIFWDGVDDSMWNGDIRVGSSSSVYTVYRKSMQKGSDYIWNFYVSPDPDSGAVLRTFYQHETCWSVQRVGATVQTGGAGFTTPSGVWHIASKMDNPNNMTLSVNGRPPAVQSLAATGQVSVSSGLVTGYWSRGSGGGQRWNGEMAALLVFDGEHDEVTRKKVERMLSRTYGIPLE